MSSNGKGNGQAPDRGKTVGDIDSKIDFWDFDAFMNQEHHDWFKTLRNEEPGVHWYDETTSKLDPEDATRVNMGTGFWAVCSHEALREVNRNPEVYSSYEGGTQMTEIDVTDEYSLATREHLMLTMDPPKHTRYRKLINRGFTPRMIGLIEKYLENRTRMIVDKVSDRGEAEFVTELSAELPLQAIAELVGVPLEDRGKIFEWTNRMIGAEDPDFAQSPEHVAEASTELFAYAHQLQEERRKTPRDDILTKLLEADVDGEKLSDLEFNAFFLLLCVAGNETTRNSISWGMKAFLENPDQWELFKSDPERYMDTAIEEIVRWATPVLNFRRTAKEDAELVGKQVKKGDKVVMWHISANRDEKVFEDPYRFDITREKSEQIAFGGGGPHFCLGANLARMEIRLMFRELVDRLPDMEQNGEIKFLRSNFIGGIKELPVKFSPTPSTNTKPMELDHPTIKAGA